MYVTLSMVNKQFKLYVDANIFISQHIVMNRGATHKNTPIRSVFVPKAFQT